MSHFTDVDIQVRDLDALQAACQELNLGFETNAQARGYRQGHGGDPAAPAAEARWFSMVRALG